MASPPEAHSSLSPARAHRALEVLLAASVLAISFGLCVPALRLHSTVLTRSEFYGHAYAIPAVAAYLVFQKRTQIRGALHALRPPTLGPLVAFGFGMLEAPMVMGDVGFGAAGWDYERAARLSVAARLPLEDRDGSLGSIAVGRRACCCGR